MKEKDKKFELKSTTSKVLYEVLFKKATNEENLKYLTAIDNFLLFIFSETIPGEISIEKEQIIERRK